MSGLHFGPTKTVDDLEARDRASGIISFLNHPGKRGIAKRPLDQSLNDGSVERLLWLCEARPSMIMFQRAEFLRKPGADDGIELVLQKGADLFGFVVGNATFTEVWSAVRERQEMSELGAALQPYVAATDGYTVAAVVLPERSLGPRRDYEVTARLAATWPPELRRRFWAFRFGGLRPFVRDIYEAEAVFGSRGDCTPPREIKKEVRNVTREGPLDQLLWVSRTSDRSISIEPYCLEGPNEHLLLPQPGAPKVEGP